MIKFVQGFGHASRGIVYAMKGRNFRVQMFAAILVIVLGVVMNITKAEWLFIVLSIGLVLSMEATNTAVEEICNKFHPETHPHIRLIKDLAAGAVLISALAALAVGLAVFLPYFLP